jgi:hypothetical protein
VEVALVMLEGGLEVANIRRGHGQELLLLALVLLLLLVVVVVVVVVLCMSCGLQLKRCGGMR